MKLALEILHWTATLVGAVVIVVAGWYYAIQTVGMAGWLWLDWLDERARKKGNR